MTDEVQQGQEAQSAPGMSAEQAADFAAITAAVGQQHVQQQQVQASEQTADMQAYQAQVMAEYVETRGAVDMIHVTLSPMFPIIGQRYGEKQCEAIAKAWAAMAVKRPSWSVMAVMGKWGPEIAMGAAIVAPVLPDVIEWIMKPKTQKADVVQQEQAAAVVVPSDAPGANTVSFGTVAA